MKGKEILNYIIQSLIGKGGMGSVYLAEHKFIKGQMAAIKVINSNMLNDFTRKKLLDEATNQSKLGHQNIAHFQNFHIDEQGNAYLVMEYADGLSLEDYINTVSGLIVEDRICPLFEPILDAIGYAHKHNILHCDIKPANIVVTKEGSPKVLDFGIAKIINEDGVAEEDNMIAGTPSYMSPEQVRGEKMDARSDIYSLGVLLYQMLTGNAPYDTTTLTEHDINRKVVEEPLPRMRTYYKYVSEKVQKVVDKATAKNPKDRYQSCAEFKKELHNAIYPPKIFRWVWISVAAFFALIVGVGTYVWDYNRTKIYYYKDYVEQWGIPQGIGELSEDEVGHINRMYRMEYRKRLLQRISHVNSVGAIIEDTESERVERPMDMDFFYTNDGKIARAKVKDQNGKVLYVKSYNDKLNTVIFQYNDEFGTEKTLGAQTIGYVQALGNNTEDKGKISRWLFTYDENGFVKSLNYAGFQNVKVGDTDGIYGRTYIRDEKGRVLEERYIGYDGQPKATKWGLGIKRFTYDENDNWIKTEYLTIDEKPAYDASDGVCIYEMEYDSYGNIIYAWHKDADGSLMIPKRSGVAGLKCEYNEKGFVVKQTYLDVDKNKSYKDGFSTVLMEYDDRGFVNKVLYLDENENPCTDNNGVAYQTAKRDEKGNVVENWTYDLSGNLVEISSGNAGFQNVVDSLGHIVKSVTYGKDRKPCVNDGGHAGYIAEYNEMGLETKKTYLDVNLNPSKDNNGVNTYAYEYDKRGNLIKVSCFDENNNLILNNEKFSVMTRVYDDNGNKTEEAYFDIKNEPCLYYNRIHKIMLTYDKNGNLISERYYDLKSLAPNFDDVAGYDYVRDERGNRLEVTPIGIDGKLKKGSFVSKRKFDKFDNEIELAVFNAKGQPVVNEMKYHRHVYKYNSRNQPTEATFYGKKGELVRYGDDKYAIHLQEYDIKGNLSRCTYLDTNKKPVACKEGYHTSIHEYDAQGRVIRQLYYGVDGKPTNPKMMVPEGICRYDKWGNMIYVAALDGEGNLIVNPKTGWSIMRTEYNLRGEVLMKSWFSEQDKPIFNKKEGCHKVKFEYDDKGNATSIAYWGADNKPMLREGYHKITCEYDKNGNRTMEAYWGKDGKPIAVYGIHKSTSLYNEKGQITDVRHFGTKGQPVETTYGYHRYVLTYDADGVTPKIMKYYRLDGSFLMSLRWNGKTWVPLEYNNSVESSSSNENSNTIDWKTNMMESNKHCPIDLGEEAGHLTLVSANVTSDNSFEIQMSVPYPKSQISEEQLEVYKGLIDIMLQSMLQELKDASVHGTVYLSDKEKNVIYQTTI